MIARTTLQRLGSASLVVGAGICLTLQTAIPAYAGMQNYHATCTCFWAGWDVAEKRPKQSALRPQADGCNAVSEKQDWKRGFYQQRFGGEPTCLVGAATLWSAQWTNIRI